MFKLDETIVWTTQWGTKYMGSIVALFLDHRNVECVYAKCIDHDMSERQFHFIAAVDSCKIFLGKPTKILELKVCPPLVPGPKDSGS